MKRIIYIITSIIIALSVLSSGAFAHQVPEVISVHDYSGVLSDGVKEYIKTKNEILLSKTGGKIILVMTENSEGQDIEKYCEDLYAGWSIAEIGRRNSIFIVADTKREEYAFLIGRGIRLALMESEMDKFLVDYFEPYFSKKDYDKAAFMTYNALAGWYEEQYEGLSLNLDDDVFKYVGGEKVKDEDKQASKIWIWITLGIILILLIAVLKIKRNIQLKIRQHERRILRKKFKIDIDKITKS